MFVPPIIGVDGFWVEQKIVELHPPMEEWIYRTEEQAKQDFDIYMKRLRDGYYDTVIAAGPYFGYINSMLEIIRNDSQEELNKLVAKYPCNFLAMHKAFFQTQGNDWYLVNMKNEELCYEYKQLVLRHYVDILPLICKKSGRWAMDFGSTIKRTSSRESLNKLSIQSKCDNISSLFFSVYRKEFFNNLKIWVLITLTIGFQFIYLQTKMYKG